MPKKKKAKEPVAEANKPAAYGGLNEPDTCKWDFTGKEQPVPKAAAQNKAASLAQDADNTMAGIDGAQGSQRRGMAMQAVGTTIDALRVNPYSPQATYIMAKAYAEVGKKKCSLAMLDRLKALGAMPDLAGDVGKMVAREATEPAFDPFRKEADGVLGGK